MGDRNTLMTRNLLYTSFLNGVLVHREINYLNDPNFAISFIGMYGPEQLKTSINLVTGFNLDATAVKIAIFLTIFSSNISCVEYHSATDMNTMLISPDLLRIQDVYVTILWKYLLHRYGFIDAVRLYSAFIKAILDLNPLQETMCDNVRYENMFDTTVKHFASALVYRRMTEVMI